MRLLQSFGLAVVTLVAVLVAIGILFVLGNLLFMWIGIGWTVGIIVCGLLLTVLTIMFYTDYR